ncbi:hypothetical protein ACFVXC_37875 [Streptomyces sp. NPDC058257]|uniref:hypothetical protein n=1 Tax=Streptomyces sp. NPDC058257 TaxID=3346409 RepID=UPI0036E5ACAE
MSSSSRVPRRAREAAGGREPLATAMTDLVGDSAPMVTVQEAGTRRERTSGEFALKVFSGRHFHIGDHLGEVAATVTAGLLAVAAAA